ncbi:hypothetical protein BDW66DRAFT_14311 [Aspergillus desertorum]
MLAIIRRVQQAANTVAGQGCSHDGLARALHIMVSPASKCKYSMHRDNLLYNWGHAIPEHNIAITGSQLNSFSKCK